MGYTTEFYGKFTVEPPLRKEHAEYLRAFSETRRMKRDVEKSPVNDPASDPMRIAVGLPVGPEGAYFVGGGGFAGQDRDPSILDYNREPSGQLGLWCKWAPSEDGNAIEWNGAEKFYNYVRWLEYLIDNFLEPWGYVLNGVVEWEGEDRDDVGRIKVADNVVRTQTRTTSWQVDD